VSWVIRILVPIITLGLIIFGDVKLALWLFSHLPADASWLFWAKFGIGFGIFWATFGLTLIIVTVTTGLAFALTTRGN
jgi:hypothetical protein